MVTWEVFVVFLNPVCRHWWPGGCGSRRRRHQLSALNSLETEKAALSRTRVRYFRQVTLWRLKRLFSSNWSLNGILNSLPNIQGTLIERNWTLIAQKKEFVIKCKL